MEGQAELRWFMLPEETNWSDEQFRALPKNIEILNLGDVFHIPPRMVHQIIAMSDFTMIEFSTHHDDNDSYRIIRGD